jgi:DNA-binding response OmpR family regulator
MRILIVEDEKKVANFIKKGLQQEGYAADIAQDGEEALESAMAFDYDAMVLDLMLPKKSGLDVLRTVRANKPKLAVLVLTAKGSLEDKVTGFDAGADDYLIKPFAFAELSARIRALLRRGAAKDNKLKVGDLEMDTSTRQVRRGGQTIDLKLKEYA